MYAVTARFLCHPHWTMALVPAAVAGCEAKLKAPWLQALWLRIHFGHVWLRSWRVPTESTGVEFCGFASKPPQAPSRQIKNGLN